MCGVRRLGQVNRTWQVSRWHRVNEICANRRLKGVDGHGERFCICGSGTYIGKICRGQFAADLLSHQRDATRNERTVIVFTVRQRAYGILLTVF